ncbi:uncharacterized protein LOC113230295 isoform X2 [Hyposmocoma kahamanoa]|uniref:uncharacterized protein LOC113230295 isoform X2 n=1 Tax=Hyposmocoma kahamanoa TaxID=1477025 RepID=UPI000E6D8567|nr:uncharacterized protein LOC113230295 isoform X2 [Hyposmocoma kahamanoa]
MPTYSYYADYILALTYNVHKRNKSSSDGNETSTNAMCDTKKIVVTKPTAKASDDVQPPAPKSDKGMAEGIITFALWYIVIAYNYWREGVPSGDGDSGNKKPTIQVEVDLPDFRIEDSD